MKNPLLTGLAFLAFPLLVSSQITSHFGVPGKDDAARKIIATSDGQYLVAGNVDNDASLYKYDCQGHLVDSLRFDLAAPLSYESFADVLELPNGEFVAVGGADVPFSNPPVDMVAAVRVSADLQVIAFDTFQVLHHNGEARSLLRTPSGQYIMSGLIQGLGLDFGNVFSITFDPLNLLPLDSITVFSYGVDDLLGVNLAADGDLLFAGVSVFGNIFSGESELLNRRYVRRAHPDGSLVWDYHRDQTFKNKLGKAYFSNAVENPATGNIVAAGTHFTGDTLNALDALYLLFSAAGDSLDTRIISRPGSQNLYQTIRYSDPGAVFLSVGDEQGVNTATPLVSVVAENGAQFTSMNLFSDSTAPISVHTIVVVPGVRFAAAGTFYQPTGAVGNQDCIVSIPELGVSIQQNGALLSAVVNPPGNNYTYQWLYEGQTIPGATAMTYTATANGTYSLAVTDPNGCSGADQVVGTSTLDVSGFRLYPNPCQDQLSIQGDPREACRLSLLDATGRLLKVLSADWSGAAPAFDLSGWPAGFYWLKIESGTGVAMRKVVKE